MISTSMYEKLTVSKMTSHLSKINLVVLESGYEKLKISR
jgi:hypothetical protein